MNKLIHITTLFPSRMKSTTKFIQKITEFMHVFVNGDYEIMPTGIIKFSNC